MVNAVCGGIRHAKAGLKPVLSRKHAEAAQKRFQTCFSTPHRAADSTHHSTMFDTIRGTAYGAEHGGT
eukprot:1587240-Lingulodinium_polyedra.AAC.1